MTTLMIKDLALTEELSSKAMAGVHGARGLYRAPSVSIFDLDFSSRYNVNVKDTIQRVDQSQSFTVGNEVAFVDKFEPKITGNQYATNSVTIGH